MPTSKKGFGGVDTSTRERMASSKSQHWGTPEDFLGKVQELGPIALDPCSHPKSIVPTEIKLCLPDHDGLAADWNTLAKGGLVFVNPPYGKEVRHWVQKAVIESARGTEILMLTGARVETKYFQDWIFATAQGVCFPKGRLHFLDLTMDTPVKTHPAFFPSAVSYWGPNVERFLEVFTEMGWTVRTQRQH